MNFVIIFSRQFSSMFAFETCASTTLFGLQALQVTEFCIAT